MESGKKPGSARDYLDRVKRTPNQRSTLASTAYPLLNIQTSSTLRSVQWLEGIAFIRILSWYFDIWEEQQVCDLRPSLFVFLFPYCKYVLSRRLVALVHSGPILSKACCLQLEYFLQHSMRQVTVVYFDLHLVPLHASTCIALWDFLHQVIFFTLFSIGIFIFVNE